MKSAEQIKPIPSPDAGRSKDTSSANKNKEIKNLISSAGFTIKTLGSRVGKYLAQINQIKEDKKFADFGMNAPNNGPRPEQSTIDQIKAQNAANEAKLQDLLDRTHEALLDQVERLTELDAQLNALNVDTSDPRRNEFAQKREKAMGHLEVVSHEIHARHIDSVRDKLHAPNLRLIPKPAEAPVQPPVFEGDNASFTVGQLNEKMDAEAKKTVAFDEEGYEKEMDAARMAEVAPSKRAELLAKADAESGSPYDIALSEKLAKRSKLTEMSAGAQVHLSESNRTYKETNPNEAADAEWDAQIVEATQAGTAQEQAREQAEKAERLAQVDLPQFEAGLAYADAENDSPYARALKEQINRPKQTVSKLRKTVSGEQSFHSNSADKPFNGEFPHEKLLRELELAKKAQQEADAGLEEIPLENVTELPPDVPENIDFTKMGIDLDKIQQSIDSGEIMSFEELQESLNNMGLRSRMNELLPAGDHDKSLEKMMGKRTLGFLGKPKFDRETAAQFFKKLGERALSQGADERAFNTGVEFNPNAKKTKKLGDSSPINRRPPSSTDPKGLV